MVKQICKIFFDGKIKKIKKEYVDELNQINLNINEDNNNNNNENNNNNQKNNNETEYQHQLINKNIKSFEQYTETNGLRLIEIGKESINLDTSIFNSNKSNGNTKD